MAAEDAELYVSGDSGFSGSLSGTVPLGLAVQGRSNFSSTLGGTVPLGLTVQGRSNIGLDILGNVQMALSVSGRSNLFASPMDFDVSAMSLAGRSAFTAVALLRKAFVAGPSPGTPPPNPFPGLQVGRVSARRTSTFTVDPNPPRRRKPPEEPDR